MNNNPLKLLLTLGLLNLCSLAFSQLTVDFDFDIKGSKCVPMKVEFFNKSSDTADYTFKWDMGESQVTESLKDSVSALYLIPGKKTVTLTAYDKSGAVAGQMIKQNYISVHADPIVKPSSSKDSACVGNEIDFTPIIVSSDTTIASWLWDYGDGSSYGSTQNTTHEYPAPGNFKATVFATDQNGCTTTTKESISLPIFINVFQPIAGFTMSDSLTCDSILTVMFTNTSSFSEGKIIGYKWYFGNNDSSIVKNPTYTFKRSSQKDAENINLYATGDDGCTSNPYMSSVTLYRLAPQIAITDTVKDSVANGRMACPGKITLAAAGLLPDVFHYEWDLNEDGKIESTNYNYTTVIDQQASIPTSLVVVNPACSDTVRRIVSVEPPISFAITPNGHFFCQNTSQSFSIVSDKGVSSLNVTPSKIEWWLSDSLFSTTTSATESTLAYNFKGDATYNMSVKVTSVNQCHDSIYYPGNILVYTPNLKMGRGPVNEGCAPLSQYFLNKSTFPTPSHNDYIKTVTWDFGDGSPTLSNTDTSAASMLVVDSVFHPYPKEITTKATLTITTSGGCSLNASLAVRAGSKQKLKFTLADTVFCANPGVLYTDLSDTVGIVDSVVAAFGGDGHPGVAGKYSTKPIKPFKVNFHDDSGTNTPGYYDLTAYSFYNGCMDSITVHDAVRVKGPMVAIDPITINCSDPYNVSLKATSIYEAQSWKWIIKKLVGDSLVPKDTVKMVNSLVCNFDTLGNGTYFAYLIGENDTCNCTDTAYRYFVVNKMVADISVSDTIPCMNSTKSITLGKMNTSFLVSYKWQSTNPAGIVDTGLVFPPHRSNIIFDVLQFNLPPLLFWQRVRPDSQHYSLASITKDKETFPIRGVYTLQATATDYNGCVNTVTRKIKAYQPIANFITDTVTSCLPFLLTLYDKTDSVRPIVSRRWYTGGSIDTIFTGNRLVVTDTFKIKKVYPVSLVVTDNDGCVDSIEKPNAVVPVLPVAKITVPYTKVCEGTPATLQIDSVLGLPYTDNVDSFVWNFGDGTKLTTKAFTITHTYTAEKNPKTQPVIVYSYTTSPSKNVCENSDTLRTLDIKNAADSLSSINYYDSCVVGYIIVKTALIHNLQSLNWEETYHDSTTYKGSLANPNVTFQGGGPHYFTMLTTSKYHGCLSDSLSKIFTIHHSDFDILIDKDTVCVNHPVHYSLNFKKDTDDIVGYPHVWYFGDGTTDPVNLSGTHSYADVFDTIKPITFLVTDPGDSSCNSHKTDTVHVWQLKGDFTVNDSLYKSCVPFKVYFYDKSIGDKVFNWNFGDGTTSTTQNPSHTFTVPGALDSVSLSVSDGQCTDKVTKLIETVDSLVHSTVGAICQDSTLTITLYPDSSINVVAWQPQPSSISTDLLIAKVTPSATTDYKVTYKNGTTACICNLNVNVQQRPAYSGAPNHYLVYIQDNDTLKSAATNQLYAYTNYSLNNDSLPNIIYVWKPSTGLSCDNCANPVVNIDADRTYLLTMSDKMGCFVVIDTISLKVLFQSNLGLPTAFTPNKDGKNDIVIPRGWGIKEFLEINIYNRWGELVFHSNDMNKGWDGTFNGHPQDPDTYAWLVNYIDVNDKTQSKKGYITLLR